MSAVNSGRDRLNILAYVNHDNASHYGDLVETLTGYFHADDGTKHPTMLHIAETHIGDAKRRIDALLWFNGRSSRLTGAIINQDDSERMQRLCALLHIDPRVIEH